MSGVLGEVQMRAQVTATVMRALGAGYESGGEEVARRLVEHMRAFYKVVHDPASDREAVQDAGYKAIMAASGDIVRLVQDVLRAGQRADEEE